MALFSSFSSRQAITFRTCALALCLVPSANALVNITPAAPVVPIAQTLRQMSVFEEPLVASNQTSGDEDRALEKAVATYRSQASPDDLKVFEDFLARYPDSGWRASLQLNMGLANYHYGYFSKAISSWEDSWKIGKEIVEPEVKLQVDRAVGELLRMHARLGHKDRLTALLSGLGNRSLSGQATEALQGAKEGLWAMQNDHGIAYLCGPMALKNLMLAQNRSLKDTSYLESYRSSVNGVSLAEVAKLAEQGNQPHMMVRREANARVPLPALVHWKVDHFATIVAQEDGRYHVKDPTFGTDLWISESALESESSGYFLLPSNIAPAGFKQVSVAEASKIRGRGLTTNNDPAATRPHDQKGKPPCNCNGMVEANFHSMLVSLNLTDTPIGYKPPKGPSVFVTLTYNQREANQPAVFNFSNVSPKWTTNWLSFVLDDPAVPSANVSRYVAGGGTESYSGYNAATGSYTTERLDSAVLTRIPGPPVSYRRALSDGSVEIYGRSDGATTAPRRIFLTQIIDPAGNSVTLNYDAQQRLVSISDALGQLTTFSYGIAGKPLLISAIADPFGRSAQLIYDTSYRLQKIVDVIGITSQFGYDTSGLVDSMTTPYGTTHFAYGGSGVSRWLETTDPLGQTERAEFVQSASDIPSSEPSLPTGPGLHIYNNYVNSRNTFFWDKSIYPITHTDHTKSDIKHWLHEQLPLTSSVLEGIKSPLESRIWFSYPNQRTEKSYYIYTGSLDKPSVKARLRDDGSTELSSTTYNDIGKPLTLTDAVGNQTLYDYEANQIDVKKIRQKSGASTYMTLAEYTYNTLHKPLTYTDANGQVTTYTYNSAGQLLTVTDALSHTTTYNYDSNGYLTSVVDANNQLESTLTYDSYGRVATRTDAGGNTLTYQYDNLNRITRVTYPDTTYYQYIWDKLDLASVTDRLGRITSYTYDANRQLTRVTDPAGHNTNYAYYPNGKLKSRTDATGIGVTLWERDIQGRVIKVTDPKGVITQYVYDGVGNVKTIISPDSGTTQLSYDAANQLKKRIDGRNVETNYVYDWMNRLTNVNYPAHTIENVSYNYDYNYYDNFENNRLTYLQDNDGYTLFARDAVGNITAKVNWLASGSGVMEYGYDNTNRITQITYPSGRIVYYTRNALGQITQVQTRDDVSSPLYSLASGITYEPFGPVKRIGYANGLATLYQRDAEFRPTRIQTLSTPLSIRDYIYDAAGNIMVINDPFSTWDKSYSYDVLDRLTSDTNATASGIYNYDPNGNRTGSVMNGGVFAQSYGATSNRMISFFGQPVTSDGAGNITGGGISPVTYSYNHANRMSQSQNQGSTTNYLYDGFGMRTAKQGADNIHYDYLLDGKYADQIKFNPDGTYAQVTEYIWLDDIPIVQVKTTYGTGGVVSSRVLTYIHADHLNTPRTMTDSSKKVVWRWEADAWGFSNPDEDPDGDGVNNSLDLGFPGQIADRADTGVFYNINRYYDPFSGRYLQSDPIGLKGNFPDPGLQVMQNAGLLKTKVGEVPSVGTDPVMSQPFGYVDGNPVIYLDPMGLTRTMFPGQKKKDVPDDDPGNPEPSFPRPSSNPAACAAECSLKYSQGVQKCAESCSIKVFGYNVRSCQQSWSTWLTNCQVSCADH